jgi:hypothetical protein
VDVWTYFNVIVLIRQYLNITYINGVGATTVVTGVSLYVFQSKEGIAKLKLIKIITILLFK